MKVIFRVDTGVEIGIGHFMRCLNLATGLQQKHCDINFVCRKLPDSLMQILKEKNIPVDILHAESSELENISALPHGHWLPWSQEADADQMVNFLTGKSVDWIIVDHYALDHIWESRLREHTRKILVIDDLADREHDSDVLLDQNFYHDMSSRYKNLVSASTQQLMGPEYALLHQSFPKRRETLKTRNPSLRNLLVFFGGSDANNCTELTIDAIGNLSLEKVKITAVIGEQHPALERINKKCQENAIELIIQSTEIARLMTEADLSIGAGGVSTWERCCLGLPAIIIAIARNQEPISEAVASLGAAVYLGKQTDICIKKIQNALSELVGNHSALATMSGKALQLVDGKGVMRACKVVCG